MKRFRLWLTIVIRFSLPERVLAQAPRGTMIFGMVVVALGENLRLHIVAYPPNPGIAQFGFVDANGVPLEVNKSVNLNGQSARHATIEVFDNFTRFSLVASQPQPPLPGFGMVGTALGQVLRLNVVAYPPTPCNAQLGFDYASSVPQPDAARPSI